MKYYIIAGEASGDLHGSHLIKALFLQDGEADIRCWGGDLMKQAGGTLVKHYRDLAFMGFWEVLKNIRTIFRNLRFCKTDISYFQPDVIIYVDYPGFNLRIAKWAKAEGFKNHYYISPQVWAWKENRVKAMKRDLDALYVILPFEKPFFEEKHEFPVHFVGHPLLDVIPNYKGSATFFETHHLNPNVPLVGLLPGSRKQEIKKMLPIFLQVVSRFPEVQFVIAGAPGISPEWYLPFTENNNVTVVHNKTYDILHHTKAAIVTSGTATLESALFKVPQIVCYRAGRLNYLIAKRIITLKFISLVNLIMDDKVVEELIQERCCVGLITAELQRIMSEAGRQSLLSHYERLFQNLKKGNTENGVAFHTAKKIIRAVQ